MSIIINTTGIDRVTGPLQAADFAVHRMMFLMGHHRVHTRPLRRLQLVHERMKAKGRGPGYPPDLAAIARATSAAWPLSFICRAAVRAAMERDLEKVAARTALRATLLS